MTPDPAFWRGKSVLITGHTGFKGSWLSLCLDALGADVHGFALEPPTDPSLYRMAGIGKHLVSRKGDGRADVRGDVRDYAALRSTLLELRPAIVFHLAAQSLVRNSYRDPLATYSTNVMGTVHLLEAVRELALDCAVINVTSDKCYENDEAEHRYREGDRLGGRDPYSNSKGCAELVTSAYRESFFSGADPSGPKVALASARAGNVIGGGDWATDRLLPDCIRAMLSGHAIRIRNPDALRPWQHVLDPLNGYMLLAEKLWGETNAKRSAQTSTFARGWNFGPDEIDTWPVATVVARVVELWSSRGGTPVPVDLETERQPHEAGRLELDCTLARQDLGWRPALPLSIALEWTVDWYRRVSQGESAETITKAQIERFLN